MTGPLNLAPWVQPAAVGALPPDDAIIHPTAPADPPVNPALNVTVELTSSLGATTPIHPPSNTMRLLGPGDVVGVDPGQILRRFPAPGSAGTETTHLAFIDFATTDLPWRFSPAAGSSPAGDRLRPWLVLLAVTADCPVTAAGGSTQIVVPHEQLPDLRQSWAWAHAQLDRPDDPGTGRSRLLCPCRLQPGIQMRAVLVPAFAAGVAAALGGPQPTATQAPAWANPTGPVTLPVYDHWTFTTGPDFDFAILAARIKPLPPDAITGMGSITVDVTDPEPGVLGNPDPGLALTDLPVGTALAPIGASGQPSGWDADQQALLDSCAAQLTNHINDCVTNHHLTPPIRGRYHVGRDHLDPTAQTWLDMANRDPRRRLAAGRGADWVHANQDDLMAQAWEQAGEIRAAARQVAAARAALAISDSLHTRHVLPLSLDAAMRLKAPAGRQLTVATGPSTHAAAEPHSVADLLAASSAPRGLGGTRFGRLTSTLAATAATGTGAALTSKAMTGQLFGMPGVSTASASVTPPPGPDIADPPTGALGTQILIGPNRATQTLDYLTQQWRLVGQVQDALAGLPQPTAQGITATLVTAGGVRQQPLTATAFANHGLSPTGQIGVVALNISGDAATSLWASTPSPSNAVAYGAAARLTTAAGKLPVTVTTAPTAVAPAITHLATDPPVVDIQLVLPTPLVGAPLALALLERDPNWLVAGATTFPADCATLLQPDAEVIEAIFLGANYAMLEEYLWRGFPTDRRGTPISRFWPTTDPNHTDIPPIATWNPATALGTHLAGDASSTLTVLMLCTELFERYPDLVIGAVPATWTADGPIPNVGAQLMPPAFPMIAVDARTRIIGFDLNPAVLRAPPSAGAAGYYFVLIEPPSGLRFGWPGGDGQFLDQPFGSYPNSVALAEATLQPPARVFLHSWRMVEDTRA